MVWADFLAQVTEPSASAASESLPPVFETINEPMLLVATVVGAVASLPALIAYLVEVRKRAERIDLSLEDEPVAGLRPRTAGLESLLDSISDQIDRARFPEAYGDLQLGNELLIVGRPLSGKKSLAQRIAQLASLDRLITVYNPRNADALSRAKQLIRRYRRQKIMILLPGIDSVLEREDDDLQAELDAVIETASQKNNVLVVGTAQRVCPDSTLDNLFGIKILMPGTPRSGDTRPAQPAEVVAMHEAVARYYLRRAVDAGFVLLGWSLDQAAELVLAHAANSAEIEDMVVLAQSTAIHRHRLGITPQRCLTRAVLELSISRVIAGTA